MYGKLNNKIGGGINLNTKLFSYYKFSNNLLDEKGIRNMTSIGDPTSFFVNDKLASPLSAISWDTVDPRLSIGGVFATEIDFDKNFSISYWLNVNAATSTVQTTYLMSNERSDIPTIEANISLRLLIGTDLRKIEFRRQNTSGSYVSLKSTFALTDGNWYNIIIIKNGTLLELYINGILDNSVTDTTTGNYTSVIANVTVGYYNFSGSSRSVCAMDNLRLYTRKLTQSDISKIYNNYL